MFDSELAPRATSSFILFTSKPNSAQSISPASLLDMLSRWPESSGDSGWLPQLPFHIRSKCTVISGGTTR